MDLAGATETFAPLKVEIILPAAVKTDLLKIISSDRYLGHPEELVCYTYDSSLDESLPDALLFPLSSGEVSEILKIASNNKVPVTARGAGTIVCGAPIPIRHGLVSLFFADEQNYRGQHPGPVCHRPAGGRDWCQRTGTGHSGLFYQLRLRLEK